MLKIDLNNKKLLIGLYEENRLKGYAICILFRGRNLHILECLDLWGELDFQNYLPSIIYEVKKYAQDNDCDVVIFPHFNKKLGAVFSKTGLFSFPINEKNELMKVQSDEFNAITENDSYLVSQGDYGM